MRDAHALSVTVETTYVEDQSSPEDGRYVFAYTITIRNTGTVRARLQSRHWVITDANGRIEEVRGPGVVGQHPHLTPGEAFVVGFVVVAVLTAGWWPRLGAAAGAALSGKRGER